MVLILGKGVVGRAAIEYFRNKTPICVYDDNATVEDELAFKSWEDVNLVIASPGLPLSHHMIQEAIKRKIKITNDIGFFLTNWPGIKIGVTGTNGKSTLCALLKDVLSANGKHSVFLGGNYGVSPLTSDNSFDYYVIEVSSSQLETLEEKELNEFDTGIITNISPHHLNRHGSFENYINIKKKMLHAKNKILGFCDVFDSWEFTKAIMPLEFPQSNLFKQKEYQYNWAIVNAVLDILNLDKTKALEIGSIYQNLKYRQEIILESPITVINDSKATNPAAAICALNNIETNCCWIAGGASIEQWDKDIIKFEKIKDKIKKVYLINHNIELIDILEKFNIEYYVADLESATKESFAFACENNLTLLFSPGYQSFDKFKNFEERGGVFNEYIKKLC